MLALIHRGANVKPRPAAALFISSGGGGTQKRRKNEEKRGCQLYCNCIFMQCCFTMTQSFISRSSNRHYRLIDIPHCPPSPHIFSLPGLYLSIIRLSIHLFISRPCVCRDWLIETCIIHWRIPAVIAALISERRGAERRYNQSARVLTPDTMGCADWMSGYP